MISREASPARALRSGILFAPDRSNSHNLTAYQRLVGAERSDPIRDDLSNETRSIFGRHLVVPFNIMSFHGGSCDE